MSVGDVPGIMELVSGHDVWACVSASHTHVLEF